MTQLDRSRPFGEVYGQPGAKYEQDNILYRNDGTPVDRSKLVPVNDEPTPPSPRDDTPIKPATVAETPKEPEKAKSLDEMHWTQLRVLVEANGGTWTTKNEAIEFLRGKK